MIEPPIIVPINGVTGVNVCSTLTVTLGQGSELQVRLPLMLTSPLR